MQGFWDGFEKRAEDKASWSDAAPLVGAGAGALGALHYAERAGARRIPAAAIAGLAGLGGHRVVKGVQDFVSKVKKVKAEGLPEDYETNPERYPNG